MPTNETRERFEKEFTKKLGADLGLFLVPFIEKAPKLWAIENVGEDILSFIEQECLRREKVWSEKWGDAHARFVADVMDGVKPEVAYRDLTKALDQEGDNHLK